MEDAIQWVTYIEIRHIELEDMERQLDTPRLSTKYRRIKRFVVVEVTIFQQLVQALEFKIQVAQF